ncbi:MAG: organic hydroperoxide resistance protein [Myxococcaceae bacterium]
MAYQPLYTAVATAHGGRTGRVHSDDGLIDMQLAMPTSLGGPGGKGTNPEQLFAAGYSACFESALRLVARTQKKPLQDATITAHVTIGKTDDGGLGLSVELHGQLTGVEKPVAQALMEAAHQVCPYSRATKGNIPVKLVAD